MAKDDNDNSFSRFLTAAPILGGIGVGARNLFKHYKGSTVFSKPSNHSNFLNKFSAGLATSSFNIKSDEIRGIVAGQDPQFIKTAWENALQSSDPAKVLKRPTLDMSNPGIAIQEFAQSNSSFQGNKVLKNFIGHLRSLNKHQESGLVDGIQTRVPGFANLNNRTFTRRTVHINSINDEILKSTLQNMRESVLSMGSEYEFNMRMAEREGLAGGQLMVHMSGGKFGSGVALEIPMEIAGQEGVIAHGVTQQTRRIVGRYDITEGNKIKSTLKHEQWVAARFNEKILPEIMNNQRITARQIKSKIAEFNMSTIEHSQVIPNVPMNAVPALDVSARLGAHRRVLLDNAYDVLDNKGIRAVLEDQSNNRFPSTSGNQLAKGVVSDINAQNLILGGHAFPWERRPMQAFGRGFSPTPNAAAARARNPLYKQYDWLYTKEYRELFGDSNLDTLFRASYFDENKNTGLAEKAFGGVFGGHALRSNMMNDQMGRLQGLNLSLSTNGLNEKLVDAMAGNATGVHVLDGLKFNEGEILGRDALGNPVHYKEGMNISGAIEFANRETPLVKLTGQQILPRERHSKFFLSGKVVATETPHAELSALIQSETGAALGNSHMVLGMDELRKNRSLHNIQMLTSLHDFTYQQMNKNKHSNMFGDILRDMLDNPNNDDVLKRVYGAARTGNVSEHGIGRIFGAIPAVYGADWASQAGKMGLDFSPGEISQINKGRADGIMPFVYGGPSSGGGRGSVEPRLFDILQGGQFGKLGENVSLTLTQRMALFHPELVAEQSVLETALSSIPNGIKPMAGVENYNIKNVGDKQIQDILTKGGIVDTAGTVEGVGKIYIPGMDKSTSMRGWTTPDGNSTISKLAHTYENFLDVGRQVAHGGLKRSEAETAFSTLTNTLLESHVDTITGKGIGLARNKMAGSRYLRLLPGTTEQLGDLNTIGITKNTGLGMFDELMDLHANDGSERAHLENMRARFLSGEAIGGISTRDPDIGPYSVNFGKLKMVNDIADDHIIVPQQTKVLRDSVGNEIARVGLGPMAGWAADTDGDHVHVMLGSSKIEKDLMNHYSVNSPASREYEDYAIRQQILKAKAPKQPLLAPGVDASFAAQKLMQAKTEIGKLSVPLSQINRALNEDSYMPLERKMNVRSVMERLENDLISAKHMTHEQSAQMGRQIEQLTQAASAGRGSEVGRITKDLLQYNPLGTKLLSDDHEVFIDNQKRTIKGLNLSQIQEDLSSVVSNAKKINNGPSEATLDRVTRGQGKLGINAINDYLEYSGGGLKNFKLSKQLGLGSAIAKNMGTIRNKIMAAGGEILEHTGKPLAIGFGASLAIGSILSRPFSNLDPSDAAPPPSQGRINSSNSQSVLPENIHPDSSISGEPTIPSTIGNPSARIQQGSDLSASIHIRGLNKSGANLGSVSSVISRNLGKNSNINISTRDKRTSLSEHKIDSLIRR